MYYLFWICFKISHNFYVLPVFYLFFVQNNLSSPKFQILILMMKNINQSNDLVDDKNKRKRKMIKKRNRTIIKKKRNRTIIKKKIKETMVVVVVVVVMMVMVVMVVIVVMMVMMMMMMMMRRMRRRIIKKKKIKMRIKMILMLNIKIL